MTDLAIRLMLLGLFAWLSLALIGPFLPILVWAVVLAVALAPVHDGLAARLGGRRRLAAVVLRNRPDACSACRAGILRVPAAPPSLGSLPVVGDSIQDFWRLASTSFEGALVRYRGILAPLGARILSAARIDLVMFDAGRRRVQSCAIMTWRTTV